MVSPRPKPSCDARWLSRWNGWKIQSASAALTGGPVLETVSWLLPVWVRVLIEISPPAVF